MERLCLALCWFAALAATAAASADGLCVGAERVFFSCKIRDGRRIALCGQPPATLQYRFGVPGRVELRYPARPEEGAARMRYAHYFRYRTDRAEIAFDNGGIAYAIYDYAEDRRRDAGVRVEPPGGKAREFACADTPLSRLGELEKFLPCDAGNGLNLDGCP